MRFPTPLIPARLVRRYKRFLADVVPEAGPEAGREITVHCPNPGAMTGLAVPGTRVWLAAAPNPRSKLPYAWRLTETERGLVAIDTGLANRLVAEALAAGALDALGPVGAVRPEVRYGDGSRVDFLLDADGPAPLHLEVKSVTLMRRPGLAEFPDSVTARGLRHLQELARVARGGGRAALLLVAMRADAEAVAPAADIDPAWAAGLERAREAGVRVLARAARVSPQGAALAQALPVAPPGWQSGPAPSI